MKKFLSFMFISLVVFAIVGCRADKYDPLDTNITGDVSVMLWSGDGQYQEDLGHKNLTRDDLTGQNNATIYAVAKAFNQIYPNVTINVYAKSSGPDGGGVSWDQERENFKETYGKYPDVWASTDLVGDVTKGVAADLSVFSNDPMYQSFNPGVMGMMNYYGVQAGLPQFLQPWGVYVNKSLAEQYNLDVPDPDWTIQEYTNFISQADMTNFYGDMDVNMSFIFTGTTTLAQQLYNHDGTGDFLNMNSNEVRSLLSFVPVWAQYAVWPQNDLGRIPSNVMNDNWWWGFKFFMENKILTLAGDPWMMGDGANPNPDHWGRIKATDWDIYPRPSTSYQPNTVGVVLDPLAVFNYCALDENPACNEAEMTKLKVAYTFAAFWVGDTRAWQARADQEFTDGAPGNYKSSMNDSFPLVTGKAFADQMEIWYSVPIHERFADPVVMPGFHKVLEIWEAGGVYDISDKAYPYFFDDAGTKRSNVYEWNNIWNPAVLTGNPDATSPRRTDANWLDTVLSKLAGWNTTMNQRFAGSVNGLKEGLKEFYGYTDADFE